MYFEIFIALHFTGMEYHYLGPLMLFLSQRGAQLLEALGWKQSPLAETVWSMHLVGANFIVGQGNKENNVLLEMFSFRSGWLYCWVQINLKYFVKYDMPLLLWGHSLKDKVSVHIKVLCYFLTIFFFLFLSCSVCDLSNINIPHNQWD